MFKQLPFHRSGIFVSNEVKLSAISITLSASRFQNIKDMLVIGNLNRFILTHVPRLKHAPFDSSHLVPSDGMKLSANCTAFIPSIFQNHDRCDCC